MFSNAIRILIACCLAFFTQQALAHTSEQGFVLLLPTDVYITAGVLAVVLSVLVLAIVPPRISGMMFKSKPLFSLPNTDSLALITSLLSFFTLAALITVGLTASHDPLKNLLPLTIWTLWWIGFICFQGIFGNFWYWLNPWTGLYSVICKIFPKIKPIQSMPETGVWPAVIIYILFSCFALADTAPEDPPRLALVVSCYWIFTFTGMLIFGARHWLERCECFTVLLHQMATLSALRSIKNKLTAGLPGWQLVSRTNSSVSVAVFVLTLLAIGSFDGLNETFWWFARLGINPLEFPGRSAVVGDTIAGILLAVVFLVTVFAACVWVGTQMANRQLSNPVPFSQSFTQLSSAILPIALAYHFAHYLTVFLVNVQYALAAATDPLQNGRDLLGLGRFYVTTGFFNTRDTVRTIWLTQAGAVVIGHIVSVLVAHAIAVRLWKDSRTAVLSQLPLAAFMVLYTLLGLWLLAAPRGA